MKLDQRIYTQWAAQFYVAAELARRHCVVSFTLGNTPTMDLLVVSPKGEPFKVQVKGLYKNNWWPVSLREPEDKLLYILAYVPENESSSPRYAVWRSSDLMKEVRAYIEGWKKRNPGKEKGWNEGINWSTAWKGESRWDLLPK